MLRYLVYVSNIHTILNVMLEFENNSVCISLANFAGL